MSLFAFDACFNFCLLSPSTGFFLFFVAQKGVCISGIPGRYYLLQLGRSLPIIINILIQYIAIYSVVLILHYDAIYY